jgi:hypothetical protein
MTGDALIESDPLEYFDACFRQAHVGIGRATVAVLGRVGAGKSTLVNGVFGEELAAVAETARGGHSRAARSPGARPRARLEEAERVGMKGVPPQKPGRAEGTRGVSGAGLARFRFGSRFQAGERLNRTPGRVTRDPDATRPALGAISDRQTDRMLPPAVRASPRASRFLFRRFPGVSSGTSFGHHAEASGLTSGANTQKLQWVAEGKGFEPSRHPEAPNGF